MANETSPIDRATGDCSLFPLCHTELCTSGQILREYLAVATRPSERHGLGLNLPDALGNVHAIRGRTTLLAEDAKVADRLRICRISPGSRGM